MVYISICHKLLANQVLLGGSNMLNLLGMEVGL